MAIVAVEKNNSRRFVSDPGNSFIEFTYIVTGSSSEKAVYNYMLQNHISPYPISALNSYTYKTMDIEPVWVDTTSDEGMWDVTVIYSPPEALVADEVLTFDTGGGMQHITQSINTRKSYGASGVNTSTGDNKGAIGVNGDAVDGVDIVVPVYNFTITKRFDAEIANASYRRILMALTGTVNNARFREFEAGEVLFLGASGVIFRDENELVNGYAKEYWDIVFSFAASENRNDITVGDITGIEKRGWEYMWVKYEDDASAGWLTKRPIAVYIEQVYRYGSFSNLLL
jgi:hypothetical protein